MKHWLLLFSLFSICVFFGQTPAFNIGGKSLNYSSSKGESGVTVEIVQNGTTLASTSTGNDGGYDIKAQVDYSKVFFVVFKKSGYFSKKIEMDFTQLDIELVPAGEDVLPFQKNHTIDMISTMPNLDLSFLETEPVGIIIYDPQLGEPENDNAYSNKIKKKVDNLIKEAEEKNKGNDAAFQTLFKEAENLYLTLKKYEDALVKYEQALELKPTDEQTLNRIDELDAIIQKLKEDELVANQNDAAYIALKDEADVLRDKGSYQQAIDKYNQALALKDEQYPKDQIEYCEEQIENATKYETLITAADQFFNQKSYKTALTKYQEASKIKPNEQYPKDRINVCNGFIDGQAAELEKKKQYYDMVAAADAFYNAKNWKDAKAKYAEAYAFDDKSEYPNDRIVLCDNELEKIAEAEAKQKKIEELLAAGLVFFNESKWADAKLKYEQVIKEESTNTVAQQKLIEIETKLNEEEVNKVLLENFAKLEKEGDEADLTSDFNLAKSKYEEALKLKDDAKVKQKLEAINTKIADAKEKEKRIQDLLTEADNFYKASNWLASKSKYQEVIKEDAKNTIATTRIPEIEEKIKQDLALQDANSRFQSFVNEGDKASISNDYTTAESKYTEALKIKDDQTVKDKLALVKQKILDQNALDALNKEFNELKLQAEQKETKKDWSSAQKLYEDALLKKNDPLVIAKVEELKNKIKEEADAAALSASFETLKKEGFDLADQQKWVEAKTKLEEAKKIKNDPLIVSKLALIDQEIAKNNSQLENENNFKKLSSEALAFEEKKDYKNAIDKYNQALNFKPNDAVTKLKIEELNLEQKKIEDQLVIDNSYQNFLTQGKNLMTEKKYAEAIQKFNEANKLKPTEKEPVDLAAEAEKLEKDANSDEETQFNNIIQAAENKILEKDPVQARDYASRAQKLRPNDKRVTDLLTRIESLEKLQKSYTDKMAEAEKAVVAKNYDNAIKLFQAAKDLKYDETIPQNRIDDVNELKLAEANASDIENQYNTFMKSGLVKFTNKDYNGALADYLNALNIKNSDKSAQDKISEIEQILDDLNKKSLSDNALKAQIELLRKEAETYFKDEDYVNAIVKYNELLKLEESSATRLQIAEATRLKNEKDSKNVTASLYSNHIKNGDDYFNLKDYAKAKESYQKALGLMPSELYPKEKIKAIEDLQSLNLVGTKLPDLGDPYYNSAMDGYALVARNEMVLDNKDVNKVESLKHTSEVNNIEVTEQNNSILINNTKSFVNAEKVNNNDKTIDSTQNRSVELLADIEHSMSKVILSEQDIILSSNLLRVGQLNKVNSDYKKVTVLSEEYENNNVIKVQSIEEDHNISKAKQLINSSTSSIENAVAFEKVNDDNVDNFKENEEDLEKNVEELTGIEHALHTTEIAGYNENGDAIVSSQKSFENIDNNTLDGHFENAQSHLENTNTLNEISHEISLNVKEEDGVQKDEQMNNANTFVEINASVKTEGNEVSLLQKQTFQSIEDVNAVAQKSEKAINENNVNEILGRAADLNSIEKQDKSKNNENTSENIEIAETIIGLSKDIEKGRDEEVELNKQRQIDAISNLNDTEKQTQKAEDDTQKDQFSSVSELNGINNSIKSADKKIEENTSKAAIQNFNNLDNLNDNKQSNVTENSPNEIGQAYPEGITEEYFTKTNSHGDVTTFITRRIVVIQGHGDVFVKARSNSLTTYTKNGIAISEMSYDEQSNVEGLPKFLKTE